MLMGNAQVATNVRTLVPLGERFTFLKGGIQDINRATKRIRVVGLGSHGDARKESEGGDWVRAVLGIVQLIADACQSPKGHKLSVANGLW
jgi:hypothetical protein